MKTPAEVLRAAVAKALHEYAQSATESPIEQSLLVGLLKLHQAAPPVDVALSGCGTTAGLHPAFLVDVPHGRAAIVPQLEVGVAVTRWFGERVPVTEHRALRLDFAILMPVGEGRTHPVAVECDGHEFHEKTREQAASDRARDRALQIAGWTVLRFTGAEIAANPDGAARALWGMCSDLARQKGTPVSIRRSTP